MVGKRWYLRRGGVAARQYLRLVFVGISLVIDGRLPLPPRSRPRPRPRMLAPTGNRFIWPKAPPTHRDFGLRWQIPQPREATPCRAVAGRRRTLSPATKVCEPKENAPAWLIARAAGGGTPVPSRLITIKTLRSNQAQQGPTDLDSQAFASRPIASPAGGPYASIFWFKNLGI